MLTVVSVRSHFELTKTNPGNKWLTQLTCGFTGGCVSHYFVQIRNFLTKRLSGKLDFFPPKVPLSM